MTKISVQPKLKLCSGCDELKPIWKNHQGERYCKSCWAHKQPPKTPKARTPVKPKSDKLKTAEGLYSIMRVKHLSLYPRCQGGLPGCTGAQRDTLTIHHKKGRGKYLLDTTTWVVLCFTCHRWVEEHPLEAKQLGLSEDRLTDND